jgi:hypothetical protein
VLEDSRNDFVRFVPIYEHAAIDTRYSCVPALMVREAFHAVRAQRALLKYPAGGRGDVLLAQPVGRHCSGYREDSGSGLHLQLFDGMAAVSMVITAAVRNLFRFKKVCAE